ncbi:MAG: ribosome biogenesis GTPase Der [Anaerolineae bacterium]|nr:ribosome biogenesis GTPase Der [Anaerolineae bacterium]
MSKPIVALVGRPNVGKSTLFNRIVEERLAIVEDLPGTTRDRLYADAEWGGVQFTLIDTGGLDLGMGSSDATRRGGATVAVLATASADYVSEMRAQAEAAIDQADAILFLVDVLDGPTAADKDVADLLRVRSGGKPVFLVANKADNAARRADVVEFYELGLGEPYPISALHGTGTGDLLDALVAKLPVGTEPEEAEGIKVAIVGRPNVGKSSLLNALLGQNRAIVSPIPGTTRDALDTPLTYEGQRFTLIDTAGIRRRGRVSRGIEEYSVLRAVRAIGRADVVLLLIDGADGVTAQDAHVAGYALEALKGIVVVVNKWDLVPKDEHTMPTYAAQVRAALRFMDYVPVIFISAKTRQRVHQVLPAALRVYAARQFRISTGELNRIVRSATEAHAPPAKSGKPLRFLYATQAGVDPPTFVFFVNDKRLVHFSYQRYLENSIRAAYPFEGTPLRFTFRNRKEEP